MSPMKLNCPFSAGGTAVVASLANQRLACLHLMEVKHALEHRALEGSFPPIYALGAFIS